MLLRVLISMLSATAILPATVRAASAAQINRNARAGLRELYASTPSARTVGQSAKAVLVFPSIIKGGFIVGAQGGEGALFSGNGGKTLGYYSTVAASYGLQAGIQKFGYAFFFNQKGLMAGLGLQGSKITRINPPRR